MLDPGDFFGSSLSALGDLDGDGALELAVGADGGSDSGAVWILSLASGKRRSFAGTLGSVVAPQPLLADSSAPPTTRGGEVLGLGAELEHDGSHAHRNEFALVSAGSPRAGGDWEVWVNVSAHPEASASLVWVTDRALPGKRSPFGELLADPRPSG